MNRARPWCLLIGLLAAGCAGSELVARSESVRGLLKQAREAGAYQCAPRELAIGEANVHFAEHELDQGDYFRAKDHLALAEANATEALRRSPAGQCAGPKPGPRLIGDSDR